MSEFAPLLSSSYGCIFAGFAVGFVVGLTGVGSGSLMTPAIGTDLLFAAFTKLGGTVSLARHRLIDWRVPGQVAFGTLACLFGVAVCYAAARHSFHEKNSGPDHPLALVRLAGLHRSQIDCHLI